MKIKIFLLFISLLYSSIHIADEITNETKEKIRKSITTLANKEAKIGTIKIDSISINKNDLQIFASNNLGYVDWNKKKIKDIDRYIRNLLPEEYRKKKIQVYTDNYLLEDYLLDNRKDRFYTPNRTALVTNLSKPYAIKKGLEGKHIALWQSHGMYYDQGANRWDWQRAKIFQTVEDLYTQSYVLLYLVPMLENAGANTLIPRERDTQPYEIIVDNDYSSEGSIYKEEGEKIWKDGSNKGFANKKTSYYENDNPFEMGTYRTSNTCKKETSLIRWSPQIPEKGEYAVYVSYHSLPNSTDKAIYEVHHTGGTTQFGVNQTMGGGTWIFLGFFEFDEGMTDQGVTLSNFGDKKGKTITADAVKIGGGMGNIARHIQSEQPIDLEDYAMSGYPRFTEGARYWLQWAGVPDSIYSRTEGKNDYSDDFQSRGYWVNYLAGGSKVLPKQQGLHIPIDLAFAFHSDAGTTFNDSIIGTLGICMTHHNDEKFENGKPRILSRDMTSLVMEEIVKDIRIKYEPNWTRRPIWNKSYSEARVPEVPTMLLELLSHQNFADMRYGLDPNFQFDVSRSIYKGMLKFLAKQYNTSYCVQPLPIHSFSAVFNDQNKVSLTWQPTIDSLETTAIPNAYIVYQRINESGFNNGIIVKNNNISLDIEEDKIYSFKIEAINDGGKSFPSEILSVGKKHNNNREVLIVNGFDRVSGPDTFVSNDSIAGFIDDSDHGVPYIKQYNYIGSQYEFRRNKPWVSNDAAGFGASHNDYAGKVIAGNTFDYPSVHGKSIFEAGYSFVSSSREAVVNKQIDINNYKLVDLIMGKQKKTKIGTGLTTKYEIFPKNLQKILIEYTLRGGNVFVSGSYIASDLFYSDNASPIDQKFAIDILKYKLRANQASQKGDVSSVKSPFQSFRKNDLHFCKDLNKSTYKVEAPDAILPASKESFTILRYTENSMSAGIAYQSDIYKTCVIGFPFESIQEVKQRNKLMEDILNFIFEYKGT